MKQFAAALLVSFSLCSSAADTITIQRNMPVPNVDQVQVGAITFNVDAGFTDEQLHQIAKLYLDAYDRGVGTGQAVKATAVRMALGAAAVHTEIKEQLK